MRIVSIFCLFALVLASAAGGQAVHTPTGGTVAGIAPPPVPPTAQGARARRFLSGGIPVVVLPDGRVFADFGRGYEQIVRSCSVPITSADPVQGGVAPPPSVAQPVVVQPSAGVSQPLAYSPPAPVQPAAMPERMSDRSCWAPDFQGRVFVAHP